MILIINNSVKFKIKTIIAQITVIDMYNLSKS